MLGVAIVMGHVKNAHGTVFKVRLKLSAKTPQLAQALA